MFLSGVFGSWRLTLARARWVGGVDAERVGQVRQLAHVRKRDCLFRELHAFLLRLRHMV